MKQMTNIILLYTCSICNKGFSRHNMRRHEEKCHQASSYNGIGTKRPLTTENDNMVLNKRAKPSPFTIDVVKCALQDSASKLKIDYPEDLEEADTHHLVYLNSCDEVNHTTIPTKSK